MIDLVIGLILAVAVYLLGVWNGRTTIRRKTSPVSPLLRAPFDEELKEHLARIDARVISNDQFRYMRSGIYETPHAPPGQLIFVNPETLADVIAKSDPTQFRFQFMAPPAARPADNKHLPGCRKRADPEATCICGERGFSGSNPMSPKMADEWRRLHEDGT